MSSKHLIDPELVSTLDLIPSLNLISESLPQIREDLAQIGTQAKALIPPFPDIEVSERQVPGPQGAPDMRVLVYLPKNSTSAVPGLLWLHGGGFVLGSAESEDLPAKKIATQVGCAVVSVDYRLAPETAHPGPVEDCYAALKWLYTNAVDMGVDANRLGNRGGQRRGRSHGVAYLTGA